jgi:hypothetical protein
MQINPKIKVMQFKNLAFIQCPVVDGIMAQVFTDHGTLISIVCGEGMYSSTKEGSRKACSAVAEALTFEVMVGKTQPVGWQTREDIDRILAENFSPVREKSSL